MCFPNALMRYRLRRAFRAGARGYLTIDGAAEMVRAFDEISAGRAYVSASVLPLILSNFAAGKKGSHSSDINALSDRELEIFCFSWQRLQRFGISD